MKVKRPRIVFAVAAAAALMVIAPAWAQEDAAIPAPSAIDADCRIEVLPAHTRRMSRTIEVPPVVCERQVPRYETVRVPVYETRRVPVFKTVDRPVFEEREVPVYKTERVPVWGEKEVTTYHEVRTPVTIKLWSPFKCEDRCIELWDKCEKVPSGTAVVPAIVDYEERQVECGRRIERVQVGTEPERVLCGYETVREQVGEREEQRLAGFESQSVVVKPASVRTVTDCVEVPRERVTVIPDGTHRDTPLEGTNRVLTESEYRSTLADTTR